jgi:DNA-binding transcriptional LysR family regulator
METGVGMMTIPTARGRREAGVTLSALRSFVAVVDAGGLSRAAAMLGVTQPSVSIQLNSLEEACGVLLLHRRPKLKLTDDGRDLFVRARLILSRVEEFEASVQEMKALRRGSLTIGFSTPHFTMPIVARFLQAHPNVALRTRIGNTGTLLEDVAQCRVDVGVMSMMEADPALACHLIAEPALAICCRAEDPLAKFAMLRPRDLAEAPLILREPGSMTRQMAEAAFAADGVTPNVRLEIGGREAIKEAVAAGLGIGLLFDEELAADSRLAAVPLASPPGSSGVFAVALKESMEIPTVAAFFAAIAPGPGDQ